MKLQLETMPLLLRLQQPLINFKTQTLLLL